MSTICELGFTAIRPRNILENRFHKCLRISREGYISRVYPLKLSPVAEAPAKRSRLVWIIMPSTHEYVPTPAKKHAFIAGLMDEHDHAFFDRFRSKANSQLHWPAVARHSYLGSSRSPFGF
ncbi:hypothetical protein QTP88_023434 [Uroleucon formosanum]